MASMREARAWAVLRCFLQSSWRSCTFGIALRLGIGHTYRMKAVLTPAFLEAVPARIRDKLHLKSGMVMDFDETSPYLKATPLADDEGGVMSKEEFRQWVAESVGIAKGKFTTDEMMRETRGED